MNKKACLALLLALTIITVCPGCSQKTDIKDDLKESTQMQEDPVDLIQELNLNSEPKAATGKTIEVNSAMYSLLDFEDTSEYENVFNRRRL